MKDTLRSYYLENAKKAYQGILKNLIRVREDGGVVLSPVCAVAGLGGDPYRDGSYNYYVNEEQRDNDPKGCGSLYHGKYSLRELVIFGFIITCFLPPGSAKNCDEAEQVMMRATKYMVEGVSTNGGYLWYYLPDFSRQWGEMEAYKTMIWLQHPGTISMGHLFLDAYRATGNEYYYAAAVKAASAVIWGQGNEGGWNYMVDFAGDRSLKHWYNTIGKNGWRLEEFQHYYGNSTFDDDVTSDAARFLLRIYLEKLDATFKPALDKAIAFILESQYPLGGWPQRYPLKYEFSKEGTSRLHLLLHFQ